MKKKIQVMAVCLAIGLSNAHADYANETEAKIQQLQQAIEVNPDDAVDLNDLANLYQKLGQYTQAEPLYHRSLAIREKTLGPDHPDVAASLNNLASLYQKQGQYAQAETLHLRSLAIDEKTMGSDHPYVAEDLNNLANLYQRQGRYTQAEPLYQRSLAIRENALGTDHPDVAQSLKNLAGLYYYQGHYAQAEPLIRRSLAIDEKILGPNHPLVASDLNNLAGIYIDQGQYAQAEPLLVRSLTIDKNALGSSHPDVASDLSSLAGLYIAQGQYAKAEPLNRLSLAIQEQILGLEHPLVASELNNLALLYYYQSKFSQAEPLYQRSLAIREKALGANHPDVAGSLGNLALLYYAQGQYMQAEPMYRRSLAIQENALGPNNLDVANSLNNLALLYNAQGQYAQAEPFLQRSLRIMNQILDRWLWGAGEKTRQSYLKKQEWMRNYYLSFYSLRNTPEEALYYSLSRKGLLLRISSEVSALTKQSPDPAVQQQKQQFNVLRTQLSTLLFSGKADKAQIAALEAQSEELERQLSQQLSGFKRSQVDITPAQVREQLANGQSLVDFLVYKPFDLKTRKASSEQVMALVADKSHGVQLVKLGDFAPIAEAIKTYRSAIKPSGDNDKTRTQAAQTLYQQLWQPLTAFLQNTRTVYVVPDGMLHLLPFKALQDSTGAYLAEKQHLVTLSSARDIVLPPTGSATSSSAIFAGPDYGDTEADANTKSRGIDLKDVYFGALPGALAEGEQIDKLFGKKKSSSSAQLFVKDQATEQQITAITSPKILHLATHGFFLEDVVVKEDPNALNRGFMVGVLDKPLAPATQNGPIENPLARSGLAFANANFGVQGIKQADNTDGILTALEVLNLNLEGTDLVTLSACETGVGEVKVGEGVYSLNRAFQEAGAKAVLSTLWQVHDEGTQKFMQAFYQRFLDGTPAQQAIQETQNEFIHDKDYSSPYYWAGFVMMGKE